MTTRFAIKRPIALAALLLTAAAPLAQERLVINVGQSKRPASSSHVIHYQGTGSVRHSEQRTYEAAQERRNIQEAHNRSEAQAGERRVSGSTEGRREVRNAGDRRTGGASDRHGSVRLDTVR